MNEPMQHCIENCEQCHAVCLQTLAYCLQMGGPHAESDHIRTMQDCADICRTSADFMLRDSPLHKFTCGACAEICARCAEACARFDDERMRDCSEMCRRCAESCRQMVAMLE